MATYECANGHSEVFESFVPDTCSVCGTTMHRAPGPYERLAREAGWFVDSDDEGVACFVNEHGTHEYSYAPSWRALCEQQGLGDA